MGEQFYVYAYFKPGAATPFYVGKGIRYRSRIHLKQSHNPAVVQKIVELRVVGLEPEVKLLFFGSDDECKREEIRLIELFGRRDLGRGPLLNCTNGGDGLVGRLRAEAELETLRNAAKQQWASESGRRKKLEGINRSWREQSTRENRLLGAIKGGATLRAKFLADPQERRRLSDQMKHAWKKPDYRQRAVATAKARSSSPEKRTEMSARIRRKHEIDPDYRHRISAGVRERLKDRAVRERVLAAARDPVRRAKISAARKGMDNMSESTRNRVSRALAKLSPEDVSQLRTLYAQGRSLLTLARLYSVSDTTVYRAIHGLRRTYNDSSVEVERLKLFACQNRTAGARQRRRLREADVAGLFRMRASGFSQRDIAMAFGVSRRTIHNILAGHIYVDWQPHNAK
jgi:DNA invertase Pin-like site-specific DNA recombinase